MWARNALNEGMTGGEGVIINLLEIYTLLYIEMNYMNLFIDKFQKVITVMTKSHHILFLKWLPSHHWGHNHRDDKKSFLLITFYPVEFSVWDHGIIWVNVYILNMYQYNLQAFSFLTFLFTMCERD